MVLTEAEAKAVVAMGWTAFDEGQLAQDGTRLLLRIAAQYPSVVPEYFLEYLTKCGC